MNIINVDASENKLDGINFGGYRIGVVDNTSGETFTFTNTKARTIQDGEAFAVLKGVEVGLHLGYKKIKILTDNQQVANEELTPGSKGFIYLMKAKEKAQFKMKWIPRKENEDADHASRQKIIITPKENWI